MNEDIGERRERKLTERGLSYSLEVKYKNVQTVFRALKGEIEVIKRELDEGSVSKDRIEVVRVKHSEWLENYDKLYSAREEYANLLTEAQIPNFREECESQDTVLQEFKRVVEDYFIQFGSIQRSNSCHSVISQLDKKQASSRASHNSITSILSAQIHEKQKQVELQVKAKALKEREKIEMEKLKVQLKEEELEIQTQLEISEAKSKALHELEEDSMKMSEARQSVGKRSVGRQFVRRDHVVGGSPQVDTDVSNVFNSVIKQLKKPTADIHKFSGDPLEFPKFIRQFKTKVIANTDSDDERMSYLEQFTTGEARKIVTGYSFLPAHRGFRASMEELQERYGNEDSLANALIGRALKWPDIKVDNAKMLDEYGIFLSECENAVKSLPAVKILEYPDNLRKLVMKLPRHYHERWRNVVLQVKESGRHVKFSDFVKFVKKEAKKATDPMYGRDALQVPIKQTSGQRSNVGFKRNPNSSFSTSTTQASHNFQPENRKGTSQATQGKQVHGNIKVCIYCNKQGHKVNNCQELMMKPHMDRLLFIRNSSLCFRCLSLGHASKDCTLDVKCNKCQGNHQTILHMSRDSARKEVSAHAELDESDDLLEAGEVESTLSIIPVCVSRKGGLKAFTTYAFLDPGSTVSFCSEDLLNKLGCSGKTVEITIDTMGKPHTSTVQAVNGLQVHNLSCDNTIVLPTLYSKDSLPVTSRHIPTSKDVEQWSHLADLQIPQVDSNIDLLIGCNVPEAYSPLEVRTGPKGSPHATRTNLGWILWNVMRTAQEEHPYPIFRTEIKSINEVEEIKTLNKLVRESINYDFPEKGIDDKRELSQEDRRFLQIVSDSIFLQDGYYHIKLPFRQDDVVMPNNSSQALRRLTSLKKRFKQNKGFHDDYKTFMSDIISKGYAEEVPSDEQEGTVGKQWYIPHHAVYHPKKPGKIRVVFDCAATYQGVSLNTSLLQGPDLTTSLLSILLRFREESVAIIADIESMYYRVRVPREDCNFLRFYWWPDGNYDKEPMMYRMLVHLFGAVSSASCASYALQQTARDNAKHFETEIIKMVKSSFYVDDCLASKPTEEKAIQVVKDVTSLCSQGNFRLTKWISNSLDVLRSVPEKERAKCIKQLDLDYDKLPSERALGVFWSVDEDLLSFRNVESNMPNTRRSILSLVSQVFDPLGIVSPFVLCAKVLLQGLCTKYSWDEVIDNKSANMWNEWQSSLPKLNDVRLERCYKPCQFGSVISRSLHAFSDASDVGYGVVIYLRQVNEAGDIHCSFVMAKSRVAPVKKVTVPRMELAAAAVAVRLVHMVKRELNISSVTFWTDSMSVLRYIASETARFKTFVANRVNTIREGSDVTDWRYIQSSSNPADHASRGLKLEKLLLTQVWLNGPNFLWEDENTWPQPSPCINVIQEDDPEVKKAVNTALIDTVKSAHNGIDALTNHYSSWLKVKKAVGWLLIFMKYLQLKRKRSLGVITRSTSQKDKWILTPQILEEAEQVLIRHNQSEYFKKELKALEVKESISKSSSLYRLNPFLKDQIIRVGGRLSNARLNFDAKHQIIIPKDSPIARLILEDIHRSVGHLGRNTMLSKLRQRYWVPGANAVIRSLISRCVICKKYQAPVCQQMMADLPEDRVTSDVPPFSQVGMDYFGPFVVKRGRASVKRYGVIFTCLNIRAIHLELASSLDTDSCINAIRRFIARRGPPTLIRSDNGTNLVGSDRELREELTKMNASRIKNAMLNKGIEWVFNPPAASHFGGAWERMIRSVRKVLSSLMNEQVIRLDDEGLYTLMCEAETILNGRPLTEVSSDCNDISPLTPNHLLLGRASENMPPGLFSKNDQYCRRRWRQIQYLADLFWKRWVKEYLPILQERQRWTVKRRNLQVGDVVLLADNTPRNCWSLGRVTETMMDRKGYVRVARVKTATTELSRPVDKLCLILANEL